MIKRIQVKEELLKPYKAIRNQEKGSITIHYNDKNIKDEEKTYEFFKDGSASSVSNAWGTKTELPPGTFSDVMFNLKTVNELNSQVAMQLANLYDKTIVETVKK